VLKILIYLLNLSKSAGFSPNFILLNIFYINFFYNFSTVQNLTKDMLLPPLVRTSALATKWLMEERR